DQPWTDARSRESAGRLLGILVSAGGWRDVPHLLQGDKEEESAAGGVFEGLLDDLQPNLTNPRDVPRRPCRHDDVVRLLLTNMEMEQKMVLRRVYATALPKYIHRLGVCVCRHLQRVDRVLLGYLEVSDPPQESSRSSALDALETLLPVAWPRIDHRRVGVFLRCLLRLLVDVTSDRLLCTSVKEKLTNQTARCLTLLNHCSNGRVQSLLQLVDSSCASAPMLRCLKTVTMATER
ncbi:hypothetical protein CRUP_029683, partial [Coryphaenoides rupestris]